MEIEIINKIQKVRTLNFDELNLSKSTLNGLNNAKLKEATSLQQSIISNVADNQHVVINTEDDSDKVTGIAIAALEELQQSKDEEGSSVLIITDSPKHAHTICDQLQTIGLPDNRKCLVADDEGNADKQAEAIREEPAIIVANPNRLQDLLQEHRFIFRHIKLLVLDNVDLIQSNEQAENLKRIKRRVLSDYTSLICSGKWDSNIKNIVSGFVDEPIIIGFGDSDTAGADTPPAISGHINQGYINVPYRMKITTLMAHVSQSSDDRCIIFTASKRGTDRLYRILKKENFKATSLHGKLSDEKRAQRFSNFTNGDVQYLLVADISAADLDVQGVNQVINYDVPNSSDEYRFRAALLGSNKSVQLVSLVSKQDRSDISELQNELGQTPDEIPLPDEVKKKVNERKEKKSKKSSNGQRKSRGNNKKKKKKSNEMELPRPSYDKLSGGRTGNHNKEKTGIVKFFKKLFSS